MFADGRSIFLCAKIIIVAGRIDSLFREIFAKKDWADYYLGLYGDDGEAKGWLDAKAYVAKLAAFTKAHGTKLLIANLPELHDVQHYRLQRITDLGVMINVKICIRRALK